jgi:hypothetical protein
MRKLLLSIGMTAAFLLSLTGTAFAETGSPASCAGIGSSWAGAMQFRDDVAHNTKEYSASLGLNVGDLVHQTAQDHAGSFFGCFGFQP